MGDEIKTSAVGSAGNRRDPVKGFLASVQRAVGAVEFERARVEMKAVETLVHLRLDGPWPRPDPWLGAHPRVQRIGWVGVARCRRVSGLDHPR